MDLATMSLELKLKHSLVHLTPKIFPPFLWDALVLLSVQNELQLLAQATSKYLLQYMSFD